MSQNGLPTSLADVIKRGMRAALSDIHTMIPGRVVRVNTELAGAEQRIKSVDVQPLIASAYLDETLARQVEALPQIVSVPVAWVGAGGYRMTCPINVGDTGEIRFSEASLDLWLTRGGDVDPGDDRRCHLADAVFSPGLRSFATPWQSVPTDRMTIGDDTGLQIHVAGQQIRIGSNVPADLEPVALGQLLYTFLVNLILWLTSHTHPTPAGASSAPTNPPPSVPDFRAPSVSVKRS